MIENWPLLRRFAQQLNVGIGDEIFITGLFANYTGEHRNVPILRMGNLAAYPQERVQVEGVEMDAYLIEARSIGGLSGSPVFYHSHGSHVGILRPSFPDMLSPVSEQSFYLIGMVHGHYTAKENKGIAIVVPISSVLDFIDQRTQALANQTAGEHSPRNDGPGILETVMM